MRIKDIITAGKDLAVAGRALILVHGRGGSAEDILSLADHLPVKDYALLAPQAKGITRERIFLAGFSQGACLTLEFAARNAARYGGVAAFTGGLIGDRVYNENYKGDFAGTPFFIGTGDRDPHVPLEQAGKVIFGMDQG